MRINKGILYGAGAYILWGLFPIYFKLLHTAPALQIVAHRVVWSFLFLVILVWARRQMPALRQRITPRVLAVYSIAGALLTLNWLTYVWAVNAGYVIESSLGYFINPLVNVLLGVVLLRERLRPLQWLPVGIAAIGVAYLTVSYGSLPWIALALAGTFGLYGLIKKISPLGSLYGLTLETGMVFLPALAYLLFAQFNGTGAFLHTGALTSALLLLAGVVTAVPLLLFAAGARRIPLSMMGLLQYVAPTLQFLSGVFLFAEPFTVDRLVGFAIIWLALILFSLESLGTWRRAARLAPPEEAEPWQPITPQT